MFYMLCTIFTLLLMFGPRIMMIIGGRQKVNPAHVALSYDCILKRHKQSDDYTHPEY